MRDKAYLQSCNRIVWPCFIIAYFKYYSALSQDVSAGVMPTADFMMKSYVQYANTNLARERLAKYLTGYMALNIRLFFIHSILIFRLILPAFAKIIYRLSGKGMDGRLSCMGLGHRLPDKREYPLSDQLARELRGTAWTSVLH